MPDRADHPRTSSSTVPDSGRRAGRIVVAGAVAVALVSLVIVMIAMPDGVRRSADPGTPATPLWMILMPALVAVVLTRLVPFRTPDLPPVVADRRKLRQVVAVLLGCAVAFPLVVGLASLTASGWYYLAKIIILVGIPGVVVILNSRGHVRVSAPRRTWQWVPPMIIVIIWWFLALAAPWALAGDYSSYDPWVLIIQGTLTLITASVAEEIFYRRWLQTSLEGLLGRWGGVAIATLAFAAMHVGGDRQGSGAMVEIASAVVIQGSFGFMLGYLWTRFRNIWICILIHALSNGYAIVVTLVSHQ